MSAQGSTEEERFLGCLLGLAVGDALGAAVECMPVGSFEEVTGMRDGGKYNLLPGQWTDDTSLALCIAESIIENEGKLLYEDFHHKFREYFELGHLTSTGECFDIGKCTLQGMNKYKTTKEVFSGSTEDCASGNGSIMRLAPIPMLFAKQDQAEGIQRCAESSKLTHGGKFAVQSCKLQGAIIMRFLKGDLTKDELFSNNCDALGVTGLCDEISNLLPGGYADKVFPGDIQNKGFSLKSLEAALWAFYHTNDFASGVLKVVNMGDDADTVAAIYGQIAGAFYGLRQIPQEWVDALSFKPLLESFAKDIYDLGSGKSIGDNRELYATFNEMENSFRELYRKFSPGPRMYSSVAQFDADIVKFQEMYNAKVTDEPRIKEILLGFDKGFNKARSTLEQRCNRPKIAFGFGKQ